MKNNMERTRILTGSSEWHHAYMEYIYLMRFMSCRFELLWRDFFTFLIEKHGNKFFQLSGLGLPQQEPPSNKGNPMSAPAHAKAVDGHKTLDGYWLENDWDQGENSDVRKWCYGTTGVPFIDANMRELKETGYMSNRGRQNVASFFTRDMGHQDWRLGAEWFESYLLDYDIVSQLAMPNFTLVAY
jgi:deoxyribodipyrimidine photo-lyase